MASLGHEVTGLDLNKARLHAARERRLLLEELSGRPLPCRFVSGSLFDGDLDLGGETFDIVWMEEAFHHLEPRNEVGERIAALLPSGGRVVIAETNALNPLIQLQLLRSRGLPKVLTVTDDRGRAHQYGVERVTSARKLARLFEKAGFETELVRHQRFVSQCGCGDHNTWKQKSRSITDARAGASQGPAGGWPAWPHCLLLMEWTLRRVPAGRV